MGWQPYLDELSHKLAVVRAVNERLTSEPKATLEYPGYIHFEGFNFGTANGNWGWERNEENGTWDDVPPNAPTELIANMIYMWAMDSEFRAAYLT